MESSAIRLPQNEINRSSVYSAGFYSKKKRKVFRPLEEYAVIVLTVNFPLLKIVLTK